MTYLDHLGQILSFPGTRTRTDRYYFCHFMEVETEEQRGYKRCPARDPNRYLTKEDIQMANKHMKHTLPPILLGKCNTTMRYRNIPIRMAKIQNTDITQRWQRREATGGLTDCRWERRTVQSLWKTAYGFLTKLNILLPYNPASTLLGIYPEELKLKSVQNLHTNIYSSFSHFAKTWKQPRWPSVSG